jgi:hypothetical protein
LLRFFFTAEPIHCLLYYYCCYAFVHEKKTGCCLNEHWRPILRFMDRWRPADALSQVGSVRWCVVAVRRCCPGPGEVDKVAVGVCFCWPLATGRWPTACLLLACLGGEPASGDRCMRLASSRAPLPLKLLSLKL